MNKYVRKLFGMMFQSQQTQQVVHIQSQPSPISPEEWRTHWQAKGFPWRTEPEIDVKRQEELSKCRTIVPDIQQGIYPFKGMKLSRADVEWLLATHENERGPIDWSDESQRRREGLDIRGADLRRVDLHALPLARLHGGLTDTELSEAGVSQRFASGERGAEQGNPLVESRPRLSRTLQKIVPLPPEADVKQHVMNTTPLLEINLIGAQLEGVNLGQAQLEGANLYGAQLKWATLYEAQLEGADLRRAELKRVNLIGAQLKGATLGEAELEGADLRRAQLEGANLYGAQLKRANLIGAQLKDANLYGAQLEGADLRKAQLEGASLYGAQLKGANLNEAQLKRADFHKAQLEGATLYLAQLEGANLGQARLECAALGGAVLEGANLYLAQLKGAGLYEAKLKGAVLAGADFRGADLRRTELRGADLRQAQLEGADLSEAQLEGADLSGIILCGKQRIGPRLVDVQWSNTNLAVVDWSQMKKVGDEYDAQQKKTDDGKLKVKISRLDEYRVAVRANRQLAVALETQGLSEEAAHFAYRAQKVQRVVLRRQRKFGRYLFSLFLDLLAGYGYRPGRSVIAYLLIIFAFMGLYLLNSHAGASHLRWDEALVLSVSSFHGRGFFSQDISLGDTYARLAAAEAVVGLLVEISFIATFTQRFFGK